MGPATGALVDHDDGDLGPPDDRLGRAPEDDPAHAQPGQMKTVRMGGKVMPRFKSGDDADLVVVLVDVDRC